MKDKLPLIHLEEVNSNKGYKFAVKLFKEYVSQLGIDLEFQNFNKEIRNISVEYARPNGVIIIAYINKKEPIGCVGIRKFEETICELKRMYLKIEYRELGIGKALLREAIKKGKELGYYKIRLDTLPSMLKAIDLYRNKGFYEIKPYRFNPIIGTKYYELKLKE